MSLEQITRKHVADNFVKRFCAPTNRTRAATTRRVYKLLDQLAGYGLRNRVKAEFAIRAFVAGEVSRALCRKK